MNLASRVTLAGLSVASVAMIQAASAMGTLSAPPTSVPADCGPNIFLCRIGTYAQCINGHWNCLPAPSSSVSSASSQSSASFLPCGALNMLCIRNTRPVCSDGHWTCVPDSSKQSPTISSLDPLSGPAGTQVTITGTNFMQTGDIVSFGSSRLIESSPDGTHITFTVPAIFTIPCMQSTPRCLIATYPLKSGVYRVRVTTSNGLSNVKGFWLTGGYVLPASSSSVTSSSSSQSTVGDSCMCPPGQAWDASAQTCGSNARFMCPMYAVQGGWCGCDGKVYSNSCFGAAAGVKQGQNCRSNSVPSGSASSIRWQ